MLKICINWCTWHISYPYFHLMGWWSYHKQPLTANIIYCSFNGELEQADTQYMTLSDRMGRSLSQIVLTTLKLKKIHIFFALAKTGARFSLCVAFGSHSEQFILLRSANDQLLLVGSTVSISSRLPLPVIMCNLKTFCTYILMWLWTPHFG